MKNVVMSVLLATALVTSAGCNPSGTPGIEGSIELSPDILLAAQSARQIFVGAYGAEQLRADGWPDVWAEAKFSQVIDNLTPKDYDYSFITGSSERLYVYAFLDQNGLEEDPLNTEPNAMDINGEIVKDVIGRYARNPVVPIDDVLQDIDIVLNVEMDM